MVYSYPTFVLKKRIRIIDYQNQYGAFRTLLAVPFNNNSKKYTLVILQNPSKANKINADRTVQNVLNYCYEKGYGRVYIMNLFAYYTTYPDVLFEFISKSQENFDIAIGTNSNKYLDKLINKVDNIIVAWGKECPSEYRIIYKKRIKDVVEIISIASKKLKCVEGKSTGIYPKHGRTWNNSLKLWNWDLPRRF